MKKKIIIAKSAGFCFGVRRAITLAEKTAEGKKKIYSLGPLIHNPQEVKRLEKHGVKSISRPERLTNATLVLRTHGIPAGQREKLLRRKLEVVDATCPFVKRAQDAVRQLSAKQATVIIVGERTHPEVVGLVSYGGKKCYVVENIADARKLKLAGEICVVSQTTQTPENFNAVVTFLKKKYKHITTYNTICRATIDRQSAASGLARRVDVMVVVGGKNSGNTRRLAEICRAYAPTYHIETSAELKASWFAKAARIGLTAGASTPDWIINDVKAAIAAYGMRN